MVIDLDERQLACVLAGLRLLQRSPSNELPRDIAYIASGEDEFEVLNEDEIDELCFFINYTE